MVFQTALLRHLLRMRGHAWGTGGDLPPLTEYYLVDIDGNYIVDVDWNYIVVLG